MGHNNERSSYKVFFLKATIAPCEWRFLSSHIRFCARIVINKNTYCPGNIQTAQGPIRARAGSVLVLYAGGRPELSKSPMHDFMVGVSYSSGN